MTLRTVSQHTSDILSIAKLGFAGVLCDVCEGETELVYVDELFFKKRIERKVMCPVCLTYFVKKEVHRDKRHSTS